MHKNLVATLNAGDLRNAVHPPPDTNPFEFITTNTVFFMNSVNLLFDTISDFCTITTCPTMSAGPDVKYLWADGRDVRKPVEVHAQQYVRLLLAWIQSNIDDLTIFPEEFTDTPPKAFVPTVKNIFKRLLRVYAHLYFNHVEKLEQLGMAPHLSTGFKHFYLFSREFNLIEKKDMEPLQAVIKQICDEYGLKP